MKICNIFYFLQVERVLSDIMARISSTETVTLDMLSLVQRSRDAIERKRKIIATPPQVCPVNWI